MYKRWVVIWTMVLLCIPGGSPNSAAGQAVPKKNGINEKIAAILQTGPMKGGVAGISVRSAGTGKILYEHNGNMRLRPASNMKLLTAAAALEALGGGYRFQTSLYRDSVVRNGELHGNLYIKGGGDPSLLKSDFDAWAAQLKQKGISCINGALIGDDSRYDDVRYSVDLPWSDEDEYYGAQISALTVSPDKDYDAGTVIFTFTPGEKPGQKASLKLAPKNRYVTVENRVKTVPAGEQGEDDIVIERKHGSNHFTASGTITANTENVRQWKAVWDPSLFALSLFKTSLEENGISVFGGIKRGRLPKHARLVLTHDSPPLSSLLVPFMKLSNNTIAEMLVKEMGKVEKGEGSWKKGLDVVRETAAKLGADPDVMLIRDGSGISHADLVPVNELAKLLYHVQKKDWFQTYLHALPVAGAEGRMEGGTLRGRFNDTPASGMVFAKTGSITSVSSLSGYLQTKTGKQLVFSIIINNVLDEEAVHEAEEQIVLQLMSE
ncbi:D-alanyl-D-alanine carboxypeptidase DacC [Weizmannia acidilactici]|uniref:D-alanyl-D-alanine carboxypeptidase DacC n=2 Tax=Weizmannia acidilactici TaxID=2607726 RepID=A0A5J4J1Y8_9BACI|nr:D-alanyl-D-alanine carboxypeptidase/D-alanyl-D-alanine-endopeptidase [Weizmannia acidilactici]GER67719.1 D-alanyl-D-alanine carboxypeptidase DacC [Weizmannia acidilactici]GER68956.1 D-alanyl-D-alanine carboxypeptidase DacC [Weizmannia acidilactici]GER73863.1 D-alanyl-D-alanine carboxypeptidase DacC [Weizmannia acidilactici]